jgi:NTE family protein
MTASRGPDQNLKRPGADLRTRKASTGNDQHGIALALGGGFSRGFAHLGVLEVLEQEHIPISFIAGTSIGGLLGAAYADGIPVRQLSELGRQVRIRDFIRFYRAAKGSAKAGRAGEAAEHAAPSDLIGQFVHEWFQSTRVEELAIRTAIVTTDLDAGATHVFTRGPLDIAIRASCAFPGLFPPVEHEGRRFADGCIMAPVPTAVAARMNCACVLGVAVGSDDRNASPSDHAAVKGALGPSWTNLADIILDPVVNQIGWTDFSRVDEAFDAGADAMRLAVPQVRELLARRFQMYLRKEQSTQPQTSTRNVDQNDTQSGFAP